MALGVEGVNEPGFWGDEAGDVGGHLLVDVAERSRDFGGWEDGE